MTAACRRADMLKNYTKVPIALLREIIAFVVPPGVAGFDISFKNAGDGMLCDRAYTEGTCYHKRAGKCPPLVVINVPKWFGAAPGSFRKKYSISPGAGNPRRELGRRRQSCRGSSEKIVDKSSILLFTADYKTLLMMSA